MHSDAPQPPAAAAAEAPAAPKNTFTVSGTGTAPPAPIRRGRGTFSRQLRTEDIERQQRALQQRDVSDVASSVMTSATTAVVLQPTSLRGARAGNGNGNGAAEEGAVPEDEAAAPNAQNKRNIPLDTVYANPAAALAAAASMMPENHPNRELFGLVREEPADTTRQLFFRGEKRRRYCMVVGNLQSTRRLVTLKLFGHRGLKPFKLQGKMIRLINLSVARPRTRRALLNPDGTEKLDAEGHVVVGEFEASDDDDEEEEEEQQQQQPQPPVVVDGAPAAASDGEGADGDDGAAEGIEEKRRAHETAGFPAEVRPVDADADADAEKAVEPAGGKEADEHPGEAAEGAVPAGPAAPAPIDGAPARAHVDVNAHDGAFDADDGLDGEDVDHYFEGGEDEVVPLTVQRADDDDDDGAGGAGGMGAGVALSLANSPVLTSRYFASLTEYFLREFRFLLSLEDVRQQNVSVNVNLGAAYCCLARHGSHSTPLRHATFSQFVERMNDESMQLYFIKDCPACVSRAVDRECGALDHETAITMVKIHLFSNERQSRTIARAVWDGEKNAFKLLDMENPGVSFNWSVFSLDETLIRQRTEEAKRRAMEESPTAEAAAAAAAKAARAKTVAYPFEVEFRAFRRWRHHTEHPAAPLAEAILEKLSTAEQGLITHGSSAGYEHLDLSNICEVDYAAEDINVESITVEHTSRVKPQGTDLLVDSTVSLFIENFAAARQLKDQVAQYGEEATAKLQNPGNNNFLRGRGGGRGGLRGGRGGRGGSLIHDRELMRSVLRPASKLTFFQSRGSTIHWKFRLGSSVEENITPMAEALRFVQQVLVTANDIERSSDRGGAAPEAL